MGLQFADHVYGRVDFPCFVMDPPTSQFCIQKSDGLGRRLALGISSVLSWIAQVWQIIKNVSLITPDLLMDAVTFYGGWHGLAPCAICLLALIRGNYSWWLEQLIAGGKNCAPIGFPRW